MKYSIVIPTYNHLEDLLKPCLDSIFRSTNLAKADAEIIVVANGCTDGTEEYVKRLTPRLSHPDRLVLVTDREALGYTKATNLGIAKARGDSIVLMNNDTVLLAQPEDMWLDLLTAPFKLDSSVGITGPVKFSFPCAGITRTAMAFWLVMISKEVIDKIGMLDEVFSPGMGEDGDFCIRAEQSGFKMVSVPTDVTGAFDTGIQNFSFPIHHVGNGTFNDSPDHKENIINRNNKILEDLHGIGDFFLPKGYTKNPIAYFDDTGYTDEFQKEVYDHAYDLAKTHGYKRILDVGCGSAYKLLSSFNSAKEGFVTYGLDLPETVAFLRTRYPLNQWISLDFNNTPESLNPALLQEFDLVVCSDVIEHVGNPEDLLAFLRKLNFKHLVLSTPDRSLIPSTPRLGPPGNIHHVREWDQRELRRLLQNNGFTLEGQHVTNKAQATQMVVATVNRPEISIIIPTFNHFDDAFKPCIDAVLQYTHLFNKEIIVVANGCTDYTRTYLEELGAKVRYVWFDDPVGYIRAVNAGVEKAKGKYIVLLDNDSILQGQQVDQWIHILQKPFIDKPGEVGATSPFANEYDGLGLVLHSGCTMYDAKLLRSIGSFDETFNPGYFSDADVSLKIWDAGYRCAEVPKASPDKPYKEGLYEIDFPVVHTGLVQTMDKNADIEILRKNREVLYTRYTGSLRRPLQENKKVKYSIVIPTYNHLDDLLRPCIDSIFKYSDSSQIEIIVVANGCTDGTRDYLNVMAGATLKYIWSDEALGYTKATNLGIKEAKGEFVVLLNNDTVLLEQPRNNWLDWLASPFAKDPMVGMTGPLELFDNYSNHKVLIFFCVMIHSKMFKEIGLLDEVYSPGGGEDIDFTIRLKRAGYKALEITSKEYVPSASTNVGTFPIWHKDNQTFKEISEYTNVVIKRNGLLNCKRYNNDIKLNLGAGGIEYKGFLSVDKYDKRSNIPMDITKLTEFDPNSVSSIMASHVFEHLNPYHSVAILSEWLRVLKPGGFLEMEMPDIMKLCQSFIREENYYKRMGILNAVYGSVNTTDVGGPDEITSPHLFGWWPESLQYHLTNAGFVDISFHNEKWAHPEDNLRVEAYKPALPINRVGLQQQEPHTYDEIFVTNSYGAELSEIRGKTVIDIGANLGMFSLFCVEKGALKVIAIEAQPVIFNTGLVPNVHEFPMIRTLNYAAFGVDGKTIKIENQHVGSKVGTVTGEDVETITLKTLLEQENVLGDDLVLKMDCEGSEFDVVMTTPDETMRRFSTVYCEVHNDTNQNPEWRKGEVIEKRMVDLGFLRTKVFTFWSDADAEKAYAIGVYVGKWVRQAKGSL